MPDVHSRPLTQLSEEEQWFRTSIARFAKDRISPHVRSMDDGCVLRKDLLSELFAMGLMGISVSEEFGGQAGSFFQAVLAIEELAKVDPAISVIVDVQNTLVEAAI